MRKLILVAIATLLFASVSYASSISLAWNPSVSEDVVGYKVYYGNSSRGYSESQTVGNQTSYTVTGLDYGTWYFAVTAFDAAGNESGYSNEVSTIIEDTVAPEPPSGLNIVEVIVTALKWFFTGGFFV